MNRRRKRVAVDGRAIHDAGQQIGFADRFDAFAGFPDQRIDIGDEVLQRAAELVLWLTTRRGVVELRPYVVAKSCGRVRKGLCHFPNTTHNSVFSFLCVHGRARQFELSFIPATRA